ncbi:MAG: hotdog fold thioesterase [Bacteroidetes bacterium]|nr:MAG: hotdog fold thioesterase [Bacteroidota bacterium]
MIDTEIKLDYINTTYHVNITKHLGIVYTEIGKDFLSGKMPVDERTKQPLGLLHGGASVVLAESLGSLASNLCVDRTKYYCVGIEINANHVKSATSGWVFGKATAVHIGKKTHIWDIRIKNENEELVCISRLTVAVMEKKKE